MENEKIIQLAANKSAEEINIMYEHCKDQNDILIEAIRQNLSRILMDTNEDNKITCNITKMVFSLCYITYVKK